MFLRELVRVVCDIEKHLSHFAVPSHPQLVDPGCLGGLPFTEVVVEMHAVSIAVQCEQRPSFSYMYISIGCHKLRLSKHLPRPRY
jgi:hypothetical protein